MGLKNLASKRTSASTGGSSTENVLVKIEKFNLSDPKKGSVEADHVEGVLLAPAFGLDAGTQVRVRMREDKGAAKRAENKHKRREIFDLLKRHGTAMPMKVGGIVDFERCFVDKDGTINAGWVKVFKTDPDSVLEHVFPCVLAMVDKERKKDGAEHGFQNVTLFNAADAIKVSTVDELKSAITSIFNALDGNAGFVLRGIDLADKSRAAARWSRRDLKNEAGEYIPEDIDVCINAFLESNNGKDYVEFMTSYDQAVWEVIPTMSFRVGEKSLPSMSDRGIDFSTPYALKLKTEDGIRNITGVAVSNIAIKRQAEDSNFWFVVAAKQAMNGETRRIYDYPDVPTPNMPADVLAIVEEAAKTRTISLDGTPATETEDASFGEEVEEGMALNA